MLALLMINLHLIVFPFMYLWVHQSHFDILASLNCGREHTFPDAVLFYASDVSPFGDLFRSNIDDHDSKDLQLIKNYFDIKIKQKFLRMFIFLFLKIN